MNLSTKLGGNTPNVLNTDPGLGRIYFHMLLRGERERESKSSSEPLRNGSELGLGVQIFSCQVIRLTENFSRI